MHGDLRLTSYETTRCTEAVMEKERLRAEAAANGAGRRSQGRAATTAAATTTTAASTTKTVLDTPASVAAAISSMGGFSVPKLDDDDSDTDTEDEDYHEVRGGRSTHCAQPRIHISPHLSQSAFELWWICVRVST